MKIKAIFPLCALVLLVFVTNNRGTQPSENTKEVMRLKLHYAQNVLEGIATEDFGMIQKNAAELRALSQSADWNIRRTAEYQKFTAEFSRQASILEKAARNKNVDTATVAYFELTVSCVQCHKYLRGAQEARWDAEMPRPRIARLF